MAAYSVYRKHQCVRTTSEIFDFEEKGATYVEIRLYPQHRLIV